MQHKNDLIGLFAHHKVAANLLMILMIMGGVFALEKLNVSFFPNFELDFINIRVVWSGASAEDVENGITIPLEQSLKTIDNLRHISSTSANGVSAITLELNEDTDILIALDQVKQKVDEFRNLPANAEKPKVKNIVRYERVARVLVSGPQDSAELRHLANTFKQQLIDRGIDKVDIIGLPDEEIAIEISSIQLEKLQLSLNSIGEKIDKMSRDIPAGTFGEQDNTREVRTLDQRRNEQEFSSLAIINDSQSRIDLGTIAHIQRQAEKGGTTLKLNGKPAIELVVRRSDEGDSFAAANILDQWLEDTRPTLSPGIFLHVYDESWQLIKDRINLLLKNGTSGLILVVIILYLFLSGRVAGWIAIGIPVSFMATLLVLYLHGGSINMLSLFGLIMALGIIVDDAIVVGEDALTHYQSGEDALLAAEGGARRMLAPVLASSLTTVAAFLPLMLVGGPTGKILIAIPLVIIAAISASLLESFLVLPGHLKHSFRHHHSENPGGHRQRLDQSFNDFKNKHFKPVVEAALRNRSIVLSSVTTLLIITLGFLAGERIKFNFFPSPDSPLVYANAQFVPGTPRSEVERFLNHLNQTLKQTDNKLSPQSLVSTAVTHYGSGISNKGKAEHKGDHLGSITVELVPPDQRKIRNKEFLEAWRAHVEIPAGLDTFTLVERVIGPPGRELSVQLTGASPEQLKSAALALTESLKTIPGISDIEDDMPFGREQLVYHLTPTGEALGLSSAELGTQLRTAFEGQLVQLFQDGPDEVEVRVKLPKSERELLTDLQHLNIRLKTGESVPLTTVAYWVSQRGFEILRHAEGQLAVQVSAEVNSQVNNSALIIESLMKSTLPNLVDEYGISYSFEGRSAEKNETITDMKRGLVLGLALIYLILAWVFASYGWPLVVMIAIPFGLIGALFGHLVMDIDLTILSMFGLFGLSGIVINDSIILVTFYKQLRTQGKSINQALIQASCQRLRAVLLTSLTTIAGLAPLLFETSLQAQFLIPMATSIAFGLAFSTVLVLIVIPVLLSLYEEFTDRFSVAFRKGLAGFRW